MGQTVNLLAYAFGGSNPSLPTSHEIGKKDVCINPVESKNAEIAQLVEHNLAKVGVASSSLVFRSQCEEKRNGAVVQLVRILACHARGRGFESRPHRNERRSKTSFFCISTHFRTLHNRFIMTEPNIEEIGKDVVNDIVHADFGNIAMSDIIGYITTFGKNLLIAIIVYFIGRFLIKYATKALKTITQRRKMEASLTSFLNSLVSISLNLLLAITIVGIMGIDTSSFLAVFASAGVAIGMALSGTLQNFAGGVLILILKPYKVGDFIEAQGFAGTVKEIQIFSTVLHTPDSQIIIIPNGPLATGSLKNSTATPFRRIDINVEVAYGTDTEDVRNVLFHVINADERIIKEDDSMMPYMPMTEMSSSSIVFQLRVWAKAADYWPLKFYLTEKVYQALGEAGIEIPYQQMDVHIK